MSSDWPLRQAHCTKCIILCSILVSLLITNVYGQKVQFGLSYYTGNSRGIAPANSFVNNQVSDYINSFVGVGTTAFIYYKPDSTLSSFRYLKLDLGIGNRTGTFEISPLNLGRVTTSSIDFGLTLPFSFRVTKDIDAYVALGGMLSYQYKRLIVSNPVADNAIRNKFVPGVATEIAFKFKSGSAIGYRVMTQLNNDYPCRVGCLFLTLCPIDPRQWKKL